MYLQDERLSSVEAEQRLAVRERDWRARKRKLDAAAAAVILQDFIDGHAADGAAGRSARLMLKKLILATIVVAIVLALGGWWAHGRMNRPHRGFGGAEVFVDLPAGTGVAGIADRLAAAGVVPDAWTFRLAARIAGADRRLKAGEYRFADAASTFDVIRRLERGDVFRRSLTIPEGLTIAEMAPIVERGGFDDARSFERAAADVTKISAFDPDARTLEGYLFPDTYMLPRAAGGEAIVDAMVAGFGRAFDAGLRAEATAQRMSVREVVTLASLIEKETAQAVGARDGIGRVSQPPPEGHAPPVRSDRRLRAHEGGEVEGQHPAGAPAD